MGEQDEPEVWLDAEAGPVVRPYAMTRGRTEPACDLDIISLVTASRALSPADIGLGPEHLSLLALCRRPISVAELAATLDLPLGTVRVLLGDLLERALVHAHHPEPADDLFEAVINGLQAL